MLAKATAGYGTEMAKLIYFQIGIRFMNREIKFT